MSDSYDAYFSAGLYDRRYPRPNRRTLRKLLRLVPDDGRFLDFGAGSGRYTMPLMERTQAVGVAQDICPTARAVLAERAGTLVDSGRLEIRGGDAGVLADVYRGGFDIAILAFGVLAHVAGRRQRVGLLAALRKTLKSDGVIVLSLPSARRRFHAEQLASAPLVRSGALEPGDILYERRSEDRHIDMFYHLFTPSRARAELSTAGFRIESIEPESLLPEAAVVGRSVVGLLDDLACTVAPTGVGYGFLIVARP